VLLVLLLVVAPCLLANKLLMLAGALRMPKRLNKPIVFSAPRDGVRKSRSVERLFCADFSCQH
jgi:hypothetical protein